MEVVAIQEFQHYQDNMQNIMLMIAKVRGQAPASKHARHAHGKQAAEGCHDSVHCSWLSVLFGWHGKGRQ
jgi:hypothetical protein